MPLTVYKKPALPKDLIFEIFKYLDANEKLKLAHLSSACRKTFGTMIPSIIKDIFNHNLVSGFYDELANHSNAFWRQLPEKSHYAVLNIMLFLKEKLQFRNPQVLFGQDGLIFHAKKYPPIAYFMAKDAYLLNLIPKDQQKPSSTNRFVRAFYAQQDEFEFDKLFRIYSTLLSAGMSVFALSSLILAFLSPTWTLIVALLVISSPLVFVLTVGVIPFFLATVTTFFIDLITNKPLPKTVIEQAEDYKASLNLSNLGFFRIDANKERDLEISESNILTP